MKISAWPQDERPREKLLQKGAAQLSDAELLAIFLRTGVPGCTAVDLARQLIHQFGSLRSLFTAPASDFLKVPGLGPAKLAQFQAVLEMSRRFFAEQLDRDTQLTSASATANFLLARLRDEASEVFAMLCLDSQHRLIKYHTMFRGTVNSASVYPRELVKQALADNAAAVIVAHNHPSGVAEPSQADQMITTRIVDAMAPVDIRVLDHIVVGDGDTVSFAQRGMI